MKPNKHIVFQGKENIEKERNRNFLKTIKLVSMYHPAYQRLANMHGLNLENFEQLSDLNTLPITHKSDYMENPEDYRLNNSNLCDEEKILWDVMHTTGTTTGKPTPFYSTTYDFYRILELQQGMLLLRGVQGDDLIANLFPLTIWPHGAYTRVPHAAAAMKIPVVNVLPGNPSPFFSHGSSLDESISIIEKVNATILWGVPSFIRRLLIRATELGADFQKVRQVFMTGEPSSEPLRQDLKERLLILGASKVFISLSYGATEFQGGMVECAEGSGYHNPAPNQFRIDVVDPDTHKPLEDGELGLVTLTHVDRRGTVLLRYSLGDISKLSSTSCSFCGSETERLLEIPRRIDNLVKIKGTLVNPAIFEEILLSQTQITEWQILIEPSNPNDKFSPDKLIVKVAGNPGNIQTTIKKTTGITAEIQKVEPDQIYNPGKTLKNRRIIDKR